MIDEATSSSKPLYFFIIALGFSWLFWIPAAFVKEDIPNSPWVILLYVGGLGPALAGILLSHLNTGSSTRKDYWSRVFDPKRIAGIWYLIIFLSYPLISVLLIFLTNGQIQLTDEFRSTLSQPISLLPFILFLYIFGPFPEELGWRGYALDGLQSSLNPVLSSLVLGVIWSIWHLPLFLMRGTYQYKLGLGSLEFWVFILSAVVISIFFTWIYNNNQRSILSASLFHFSVNLTGNIFLESERIQFIRLVVLLFMAVLLIVFSRSKGFFGFPGQLRMNE
jgi:membrane protease YdiL (CAAX protease family)